MPLQSVTDLTSDAQLLLSSQSSDKRSCSNLVEDSSGCTNFSENSKDDCSKKDITSCNSNKGTCLPCPEKALIKDVNLELSSEQQKDLCSQHKTFHDDSCIQNKPNDNNLSISEDLSIKDKINNASEETNSQDTGWEERCIKSLHEDQMIKLDELKSLLNKTLDIVSIQELAAGKDGFITDEMRRELWPRLLHIECSEAIPILSREEAAEHPSYDQVVMDVERTLKRFPPGISASKRTVLMDQLIRVIVTVLRRNTALHYYQGYHDVGITFLLVCGESTAVLLLEEISLTHLREFLQPTMDRTNRWLAFLYPILEHTSPALYRHMIESGVGTVFCLPWLITWYAHTLSQYRQVVRLYDFLLSSPPLMPMYVAAQILTYREQELLAVECDMAMMHFSLSQVPDDLPLDDLLQQSRALYKQLPPPTIAQKVDLFLEQQRNKEAAERAAMERRRKRRQPARVSWVGRMFSLVPAVPMRGASAVAVVAVLIGIAAIVYRNYSYNSKHLQLTL